MEKPDYFLFGDAYTGNMPAYFDTNDFSFVPFIEENWQIIKEEILSEYQTNNLPIPNFNPNLVKDAKTWRNICFYNYTWKRKKNLQQFPKTAKLLSQIPNLTYAAMNMLTPYASIYPHHGDTNTTARFHLGIIIPAQLPQCGIDVNGIKKSWHEGKLLAFSDAQKHYVWNNTPSYRYIFVIDILLDDYVKDKNKICAGVLATLSIKAVYYNIRILKIFPKFVLLIFHKILWLGWRLFLKFFNS